ncbi:MAG: hypothetical protein LBT16_09180 [Treponema sp.]|jgi:hypothetical protein|nr:hypothetical protein [Treponema sp.]
MAEEQKGEEGPESGKREGPNRHSLNQDPVFYYSREHRLERASQQVQDLNRSPPPKPQGLIRTLTATKSGTILFITIVIMSVFIFFMYQIQGGKGGTDLGGNEISLSGRAYSGVTYLLVRKKARGTNFYSGPVDLAISVPVKKLPPGEEAPIVNRSIFFTLAGEEEFPLSLPFEAPELLVVIQAGELLTVLQCKITK